MKKLSEILELAMPSYIEEIKCEQKQQFFKMRYGFPLGSMCVRLSMIYIGSDLTLREIENAKEEIKRKINGLKFLGYWLEKEGRKTTALAQIRFYRQWIKELKAEGN